jgi:GDP-L-fucose synthase
MHDGPVYSSNFAYGYAKRMVDIQIQAYKKQYKITNYCSIIPGNIFGPQDNYNIEHGHVIPSLIHKLCLAKKNNTNWNIWGDGKSLREFIYVDDLAKVVIELLDKDTLPDKLICSGPIQYSIKEIVEKLAKVTDFPLNKIVWDKTKPNGQRSRPSNLSILYKYFPNIVFTNIDTGLKLSYEWLEQNYNIARK